MKTITESKKIRLNSKTIDAMAAYYQNRSQCATRKWDKCGDLKKIWGVLRKNGAQRFEACAGTFWVTWSKGVTTEHTEGDYWLARKARNST